MVCSFLLFPGFFPNLCKGRDTSGLKHAKGRNSDIVLVPQPSESPRDPLNWPQWKKELLLLIISIDTAVVGAWGKCSSQ